MFDNHIVKKRFDHENSILPYPVCACARHDFSRLCLCAKNIFAIWFKMWSSVIIIVHFSIIWSRLRCALNNFEINITLIQSCSESVLISKTNFVDNFKIYFILLNLLLDFLFSTD